MKLHSKHPSFFSLSLPPLSLSPPPVSMNDCFRCNKGLHPGIEWQILTKEIFSRSFHPFSLCTHRMTSSARHHPISTLDSRVRIIYNYSPTRERRNCNCTLERFDKSTAFLSREKRAREIEEGFFETDSNHARNGWRGKKRKRGGREGKRDARPKIRSRVGEGITVREIVKNGARTKEASKEGRKEGGVGQAEETSSQLWREQRRASCLQGLQFVARGFVRCGGAVDRRCSCNSHWPDVEPEKCSTALDVS